MSNSTTPKISVLVPTFNNECYLRQCLDSALAQTMGDFEVICLNDGSTDASLAIMEEYASRDSRFRIIDKSNSGYGDSMNKGLDAAKGEFIAILESDDHILPKMFERLYHIATKNNLDLVKADFHRFFGEGDSYRDEYVAVSPFSDLYNVVLDPSKDSRVFKVDMCTWTGIYRRSFIEENHIRYNATPGAAYQDNGFWFQSLIFAHRLMFVPESFYQYRQDNPNSSINNPAKVFCMCEEHAFMERILDSHPELSPRFHSILSHRMYSNYVFTYQRIGDDFKCDFLHRASDDFRLAFEKGNICRNDFWPDEWQILNDVVDDPNLSFKKYESIFSTDVDQCVANYRYRHQLNDIQAQRYELNEIKASRFYRVPRYLKKTSDYIRKYGPGQLFRRAVLKEHVPFVEPDHFPTAQPIAEGSIFYPLPLAKHLAFADSFSSLDSSGAYECWYRRRTGNTLCSGFENTLNGRIRSFKNSQGFPDIGLITQIGKLAVARGVGTPCFAQEVKVLDDYKALENYLFSCSPRSFVVRVNAKVPWELRVLGGADVLNLARIDESYRLLSQANLDFLAGEHVSREGALKLVVESFPSLSAPLALGRAYRVLCVDGVARMVSRGSDVFHLQPLSPYDATISEEELISLIADAQIISEGFPFVSVLFELFPDGFMLRDMRIGEDYGLTNAPESILADLSE